MLNLFLQKLSAFLLLITLAASIVGHGIFPDTDVIPNSTSPLDLVQEIAAKYTLCPFTNQSTTPGLPSEFTHRLKLH
jgi:hypothetical protein